MTFPYAPFPEATINNMTSEEKIHFGIIPEVCFKEKNEELADLEEEIADLRKQVEELQEEVDFLESYN